MLGTRSRHLKNQRFFSEKSLTESIPADALALPARFSTISTQIAEVVWDQSRFKLVLEPNRSPVLQLAIAMTLSMVYTQTPSFGQDAIWRSPVIGSKLVNSYRQSETPYSSGHRGVDYRVELNQGVFAPAEGTVHFVGEVVDRPLISISHPGNLLSAFEPVCSVLNVGDQVLTGELIGEVCEADTEYSPHCPDYTCLHFSARVGGEYLSPLKLTGEQKPSRLLPWIEPG